MLTLLSPGGSGKRPVSLGIGTLVQASQAQADPSARARPSKTEALIASPRISQGRRGLSRLARRNSKIDRASKAEGTMTRRTP